MPQYERLNGPIDRVAEQRAQVLVDVGLALEAVEAADVVEVADAATPNTGDITAFGDRPPERVHDHRAGLVVERVVVGVEARRVAADPVVEQVDHLLVARRSAPGRCAAPG